MPPFVPNRAMRAEAKRGLDWREEFGRGGTAVGVARARDIVNGRNLSLDTVKRMRSYFARHEVDKQGQGWSPGEDGYPSAGRIAWALWGGDAGRSWANKIVAEESKSGDQGMSSVRQRETLERHVDFDVRSVGEGDGLTLSGYAAVFNTPTRIDSWEGKFDEVIVRGAFKKTLSERMPILQWNHGKDPAVGEVPIGAITTIREDARGLYIEARLHDNEHVRPIRDAIASGAVSGMSFRFQVIQEKWDDYPEIPMRTIVETKLLEVGPVAFPAYSATSVGVRSDDIDISDYESDIVDEDSFDTTSERAADALDDCEAGDLTQPTDVTARTNPGFLRFAAQVENFRSVL
jgi:HK97 family phage prohead protease